MQENRQKSHDCNMSDSDSSGSESDAKSILWLEKAQKKMMS